MTYTVDRPNIQLDAADCLAIKNSLEQGFDATHQGLFCNGPNIDLDANDLAALDASVDGGNTAVQTANLNLTAADVAAIAPHIT